LAAPAREDPREGVKGGPNENRSGSCDRGVRGRPHGPRRWITSPHTVTKPRTRGECGTPKRRTRVRVCTPSPGHVVGPKAHRFARGESLVDSAGSQRVRVIVVESLGSRHRTNVSVWCFSGGPSQGGTSREVPSSKEAGTWFRTNILTTRVGGDRAKTVRRFPALTNQGFREETGLEGRKRLARVETHIRSNHGVRRPGLHARRL
jgi:hypothetical protein